MPPTIAGSCRKRPCNRGRGFERDVERKHVGRDTVGVFLPARFTDAGSPAREELMGVIDTALQANEEYARVHHPELGARPQPKIAVVTCMDPRLSDLEGILGLKNADM